jgi:hypothetical protein
MPPARTRGKPFTRSRPVKSSVFGLKWPRGICSECRNLDFSDTIFGPDSINEPTGLVIGVLKDVLSTPSKCKFCKFVRSISSRLEDQNDAEEHAIVAFSLSKTLPLAFRFWSLGNPVQKDASNTVLFGIMPRLAWQELSPGSTHWENNRYFQQAEFFTLTGSPFNNLDQPFTIQLVDSFLDFRRPRRWLDFCRSHDHQLHDHSPRAAILCEVPEFRVIDCSSRPYRIVEQPSSCEYIALSYVWGQSKHSEDAPEYGISESHLPDELPAVIDDAIEVTLKLHFRFLWIDRWDKPFVSYRTCLLIFSDTV